MAIAGDYYRGPVLRRVEGLAIIAASFGCAFAFYRLSGFETIWPVFVFLAALFFFRRVGSLLLRSSGATAVPNAELNRRYIADALREPPALLVIEHMLSLTLALIAAFYLMAPQQHLLSREWLYLLLAPVLGFLAGLRRVASLRRVAAMNEEQIAVASAPPSAKSWREVIWRMRSVYVGVVAGAAMGLGAAVLLHLGMPASSSAYLIGCLFGFVLPFLAIPDGMLVLLRAMRARQTFFRTILQAMLMWGLPGGVFAAGSVLVPPQVFPLSFFLDTVVVLFVFGAMFIGLMVGTLNWIVVCLRWRS